MKNNYLTEIGQRLRIAREAAGLTTRGVAKILSKPGKTISHVSIGNYERGLTRPNDETLASLASVYKRKVDWLRGTGLILKSVRYRALKSVRVTEKNRFKYEAQSWLEAYFYVEKILGRKLNCVDFKVNQNDSGCELAEKLRKNLNINNHPIVSTMKIIEKMGIYVIQVHTLARIDAFASHFNGSRVIVLNSNLSNDRIRLNALHELGHLLYEDCVEGPSLPFEDIENRAFEFASHMLIPEEELVKAFQLKSMVRLVEYKERFGISLAAMIFRARKSKILSQRLYRRIWQDFSRLGFRKVEPGNVVYDRPLRMESLIEVAVANGQVSFEEVAQIISIAPNVIKERIDRAKGLSTVELDSEEKDICTLNFEEHKREFDKDNCKE